MGWPAGLGWAWLHAWAELGWAVLHGLGWRELGQAGLAWIVFVLFWGWGVYGVREGGGGSARSLMFESTFDPFESTFLSRRFRCSSRRFIRFLSRRLSRRVECAHRRSSRRLSRRFDEPSRRFKPESTFESTFSSRRFKPRVDV